MPQFGLILPLALSFAISSSSAPLLTAKPAGLQQSETLIAEDRPDPGKDMTDDPHGPNPHGRNPRGGDPHDERHDSDLPANNPDRYYGDRH